MHVTILSYHIIKEPEKAKQTGGAPGGCQAHLNQTQDNRVIERCDWRRRMCWDVFDHLRATREALISIVNSLCGKREAESAAFV